MSLKCDLMRATALDSLEPYHNHGLAIYGNWWKTSFCSEIPHGHVHWEQLRVGRRLVRGRRVPRHRLWVPPSGSIEDHKVILRSFSGWCLKIRIQFQQRYNDPQCIVSRAFPQSSWSPQSEDTIFLSDRNSCLSNFDFCTDRCCCRFPTRRCVCRAYYGNCNFFGGPLPLCAKSYPKLLQLEQENEEAMFIFVSDLWLDQVSAKPGCDLVSNCCLNETGGFFHCLVWLSPFPFEALDPLYDMRWVLHYTLHV